MTKRFNHDITSDNPDAVTGYFVERARQARHYGYQLTYIGNIFDGTSYLGKMAFWTNSETTFLSPYVFADKRGRGQYKKICQQMGLTILTKPDCKLTGYLRKNGVSHVSMSNTVAYDLVQQYYEDKYAKRSGLHYMNHIDEGLTILSALDVHPVVKAAFCVHPIYQDNQTDLISQFEAYATWQSDVARMARLYARAANAFLPVDVASGKYPPKLETDRPTVEMADAVRHMLIADKIQNRKDFEANLGQFSREQAYPLRRYFDLWFDVLNITEQQYHREVADLRIMPLGATAVTERPRKVAGGKS